MVERKKTGLAKAREAVRLVLLHRLLMSGVLKPSCSMLGSNVNISRYTRIGCPYYPFVTRLTISHIYIIWYSRDSMENVAWCPQRTCRRRLGSY